ncbi:LCP family protein [Dactylosporangium sp. AC04546]|uniref:LCP family protein n=1 Tax=Dactylosporangium sp. AC04546 TaxID=2862460 RepID=UPI001EE0E9FF|nr:LCP family protein [Dactylosporangium sp. AC04546]WVK83804.1 LCP family protein [Dactylosporangium sp. AC04546]
MEQLLRETFARHEDMAPSATPELRSAIALGARRRRRWRRIGGASGVFVAVLAVISAFALTTKPTPRVDALLQAPETPKPERLTLLLLGTDRRQAQSPNEPVRSDAIILLHVDPAAGKAFQISIPRDLLVTTSRGKDKINGEFYFGGYDATAQVVSTLAGLPIDGGAVVDFAGLQRVINQIGGVDLCVDQRTVSAHLGRTRSGEVVSLKPGAQPIVYEPGCRRFQGWEAIDYVRQRKDVDRDRHLRDLLAALAHSVPVTDPVSLSKLLSVLPESVDLHLGSRSLTTVAFQLGHIGADGLVGLRLPTRLTEQGTVVLTPDAEGLFAAMRAGTLTEWLVAHPAYAS